MIFPNFKETFNNECYLVYITISTSPLFVHSVSCAFTRDSILAALYWSIASLVASYLAVPVGLLSLAPCLHVRAIIDITGHVVVGSVPTLSCCDSIYNSIHHSSPVSAIQCQKSPVLRRLNEFAVTSLDHHLDAPVEFSQVLVPHHQVAHSAFATVPDTNLRKSPAAAVFRPA